MDGNKRYTGKSSVKFLLTPRCPRRGRNSSGPFYRPDDSFYMEHKGPAPARRINARTQPAHDALNATPPTRVHRARLPWARAAILVPLGARVFDTRVPHGEFT